MEYFFYILYSASLDKYYIGSSSDIQGRLRRHIAKYKGFTGKADDWAIVYSEKHPDKESVQKREKQVKGWKSRKMIENLLK